MGLLALLEFIMIITLGLTWQFCQKSLSTADFKLQEKHICTVSAIVQPMKFLPGTFVHTRYVNSEKCLEISNVGDMVLSLLCEHYFIFVASNSVCRIP